MHRLVIFTEGKFRVVPAILVNATLQAIDQRADVTLAALCVRRPEPFAPQWVRHATKSLSGKMWSCLGRADRDRREPARPLNFRRMAERHGCPLLRPPNDDVNHPAFLERLRVEIRPTVALSLYCLQRFRPALLDCFGAIANYHNGALPQYRGVYATAWSVYDGEERTGFAFHLMRKGLDDGPILIEKSIPVRPDSTLKQLEYDKAVQAAEHMPELLEMLVRGEPGRAQAGEGRYFSAKGTAAMRTIADPSEHDSANLTLRLRAFGSLLMRRNGEWYEVKGLAAPGARRTRNALEFMCRNGVLLRAGRFRRRSSHSCPGKL